MANIECSRALRTAWSKMRKILFDPFDFVKWLALGFTAWLAYLMEGWGGGGMNLGGLPDMGKLGDAFHKIGHKPGIPSSCLETFNIDAILCQASAFQSGPQAASKLFMGMGVGLIALSIFLIFALGTILILALSWVKARGEFMFVDNLVHNRMRIQEPWSRFKHLGNSVFFWRIAYNIICTLVNILLLVISALLFLPWLQNCFAVKRFLMPDGPAIIGITFTLFWIISITILYAIISCLFKSFVIPVMYKQNITSLPACGTVISLIRSDPFAFIRYLLIRLALSIAIGTGLTIVGLITCCIASILLSIPYIWAIITLPILVFMRLFGIEMLGQFGDEFDLFNSPSPAPTNLKNRHQVAETQKLPFPMRSKITIVAFGDSITAAKEQPEHKRWLSLVEYELKQSFPDKKFTLVNAGVGGNTSREGMARIEKDVLSHKPDVAIVEFGGNDATLDESRHVSVEEYQSNLEIIRKNIFASNPGARIIICTFPPVIDERHSWYVDFKDRGGQDKAVEEYRRAAIEFAEKYKLPLVDLGKQLRDALPDRHTLLDGVHLNEEGNKKVAEEVLKILRRLFTETVC